MVKILKPNKVVVLLQGCYADWKTVIVKNFDDDTKERPYSHAIVCCIAKYPRKVIKKASQKTIAKRSRLKTFTKVVNNNHIMSTTMRTICKTELKSILKQVEKKTESIAIPKKAINYKTKLKVVPEKVKNSKVPPRLSRMTSYNLHQT